MASFTKQPNGKIKAAVRITGHPASTKVFNSMSVARAWAKREEDEIRSGERVSREAARKTFADAVAAYLRYLEDEKRPKTQAEIARILREWEGELGRYALHRVTPAMISKRKAALLRRASAATANRHLATLSGLFRWACHAERCEAWGVTSNPVRSVEKLREPRGRVRFLDEAERERLLDACRRSPCEHLFPLVVCGMYTGARQGELLALTWEDVDLKDGWIDIRESKNGEARRVPLRGPALAALREYGGDVARFRPESRVFRMTWFPAKYFRRACQEARVKDFRFHDTRHCAASYLRQVGVALETVADVLGHKTLAMTRRYAHLGPQELADAVDRMTAQFGGADA